MSGYIAFALNSRDTGLCATAKWLHQRIRTEFPDWDMAFNSPSLRVYYDPSYFKRNCAYLLSSGRGLVLGRLFSSAAPVASKRDSFCLSDQTSDAIVDTQGRHLVNNYWGRYVAFIHTPGRPTVSILRDPTGALPCFLSSYEGIEIICSSVGDCADLGILRDGIDWAHVGGYLCFGHMITRHTGLTSVMQVHAGECVELSPRARRSSFYWQPAEISRQRTIDAKDEAKRELRQSIESCVTAWASCYDSIRHELSGGLDSSIVLACLANAGRATSIICENHFTDDTAGDERRVARLAADAAATKLVERPIRNSGRSLAAMFDDERVASPTSLRFIPDTEAGRTETACEGSCAVFSGQGGDHLFQSVRTSQIAAEYAWRAGIGKNLLLVIADTAKFTRQPIWSVARTAFACGLLHMGDDPYRTQRPSPLFTETLLQSLDLQIIRHPWVDGARNLPACKQRQVFDIVDTQNFHRTLRGSYDVVHPLISQPIMEVCLQIPSYVLTYGGIDRALVRDAFVGAVPNEILRRTTKGATTRYFSELLLRNTPLLRETLIDGNLCRQGLIDRDKVEQALSDSAMARGDMDLFTLLDAFRAELWSRQWSEAACQARV